MAERRKETRRAMARVGVCASDIVFLGLPDGCLPVHTHECRQMIQRELERNGPFDLVIAPAASDDHPDHRAVARALARCRTAGVRLAYQVWPVKRTPRRSSLLLPSSLSEYAKRLILQSYRTQCGLVRDDPNGFEMSHDEIAAFAHPVEIFSYVRQ